MDVLASYGDFFERIVTAFRQPAKDRLHKLLRSRGSGGQADGLVTVQELVVEVGLSVDQRGFGGDSRAAWSVTVVG